MKITNRTSASARALLIALGFISLVKAADNPVEDLHQLTLQWTGLTRQQDVLQSAWRKDQPILQQQLDLLEREAQALAAVVAESEQSQDQVEARRLELLEQQTRLEQEQVTLERSLTQAAIQLESMLGQLPPPLQDSWAETLSRSADPLLTSSERFQIVLELLTKLDDFSQKITLNETILTMEDGQDYLVKQIYLGASHGWYVSPDLRLAAAGMATPDGWQWAPTDAAEAIASTIAIVERRQNPELVSLPLQLRTRATPGGQ